MNTRWWSIAFNCGVVAGVTVAAGVFVGATVEEGCWATGSSVAGRSRSVEPNRPAMTTDAASALRRQNDVPRFGERRAIRERS